MRRLAMLLLAGLALAGCGASSFPSSASFASLTPPRQGQAPTAITAALYRPSGPGPFPAMVLLHDCGGINNDLHAWGLRLAGAGYIAILPDSFKPRGVTRVCATGEVSLRTRVGDAYAAAAYLRSLPDVRPDRIGLLGFSHGAGTIADIVAAPPVGPPFQAAVAYYPNCSPTADRATVPTLILIGERDDWTPAAPCAEWAHRINDPVRLDIVVYPGAWHRFDGARPAEVLGSGGIRHHLQPDAAATADATARTEAFLARWLRQ